MKKKIVTILMTAAIGTSLLAGQAVMAADTETATEAKADDTGDSKETEEEKTIGKKPETDKDAEGVFSLKFKNLTGKNVDMNDGLFEVTMITRPKNPLELQEIMTAMLTAEDNTDLIHSFKSARVTITSEEPVPWTLDGEYGGSHTQIEIENCHEALNLYLKSTKNEETRSIGISPLINKKEK